MLLLSGSFTSFLFLFSPAHSYFLCHPIQHSLFPPSPMTRYVFTSPPSAATFFPWKKSGVLRGPVFPPLAAKTDSAINQVYDLLTLICGGETKEKQKGEELFFGSANNKLLAASIVTD